MSKCEMCHYPDDRHTETCSVWLQSQLDAYKIALEYFAREGGQPARDIISNLLKEIGGNHE